MLYRLRHPGVTAFYGVCLHGRALMLVQELCPGGTLVSLVQRARGGPGLGGQGADTFFRLARDITGTLCFLHDRLVAHRDLKVRSQPASRRTTLTLRHCRVLRGHSRRTCY
jgi:serine/threonine protein kinase